MPCKIRGVMPELKILTRVSTISHTDVIIPGPISHRVIYRKRISSRNRAYMYYKYAAADEHNLLVLNKFRWHFIRFFERSGCF